MGPSRVAALLLIVLAGAQEDPAKQARDLIDKLRSGGIEERAQAEEKLKELGQAAVPALKEAIKDPDAEVSARSKYLVRLIEVRERLTFGLRKALPGVDDRLVRGDEHTWTEVFLEAAQPDPQSDRSLEGYHVNARNILHQHRRFAAAASTIRNQARPADRHPEYPRRYRVGAGLRPRTRQATA